MYLKSKFGESGFEFEIARLVTQSERALLHLLEIPRFRKFMGKLHDTDTLKAGKSKGASERAFMLKHRIMIGQGRMSKLMHHATDTWNQKTKRWERMRVGGTFDALMYSLAATRWYVDEGRDSLRLKLKDLMPKLTKLMDGDKVVGCMADPLVVMTRCMESAIGDERYHVHFVIIEDASLPPGHVRVLLAITWDGYPRNKKVSSCELAVSVAQLLGAAHSPENQWIVASGDFAECSPQMTTVYDAVDVAHRKIKESESSTSPGIPLRIPRVPADWKLAKLMPDGFAERAEEPVTVMGHVSLVSQADLKAQSAALRVASGAATAARSGGLRVLASKLLLLKPEWKLVTMAIRNWRRFISKMQNGGKPESPAAPDEGWAVWTSSWVKRQVDLVKLFREDYLEKHRDNPRSAEALKKAILDFCDLHGHCFSDGELPCEFALTGPYRRGSTSPYRGFNVTSTFSNSHALDNPKMPSR